MIVKEIHFTCKGCPKHSKCKKICWPVSQLIKKDRGLRELLPPPDISSINRLDHTTYPPYSVGYKEVLQANIEARRDYIPTTIKEVRQIHDPLQRAVAAMLYAELSITDVAIIIDKSTKTVRRICKR